MNPLKRYQALPLLLFIFFSSFIPASAQRKHISGIVKDSHSEERIPFASIQFNNTTIGKLSDSSGSFSFALNEWPSDTLQITCVGYQPFKLALDLSKDSILATINMERGSFNEGAKVKVKVNKGLLVWRKIVQHKPENNRYRFDNFSYGPERERLQQFHPRLRQTICKSDQ
jgi:hypothetical protein